MEMEKPNYWYKYSLSSKIHDMGKNYNEHSYYKPGPVAYFKLI